MQFDRNIVAATTASPEHQDESYEEAVNMDVLSAQYSLIERSRS